MAREKKAGRPTKYTQALGDAICDGLMDGESLVQICADLEISRRAVLYWMKGDADFSARCARAREMQSDLMDDMIFDLAKKCDETNYQSTKVKISAYQWRASKLAPKKYGDKVQNEISGKDGAPIEAAITVQFLKSNAGSNGNS